MNILTLLTKSTKAAFQAIRKNPLLFILSIFIDFLFLLFSFAALGLTIKKIFDSLKILVPILNQYSAIAQQISVNPESAVQPDFSNQNALLSQHLNIIANSALVLVLALFIAWCILQSINWLIANKMLGNKTNLPRFFGKFSLISLILFLVASLISIISFDAIRRSMTSVIAVPQNTTLIVSLIVFLAAFYFIIIAYSLIQKYGLRELLKKTFMISIKRIKYAFSIYLILIFVLFLIFLILKYSFAINYLLAIILFLAIFMPYLTIARIFLIRTMNEMEKEK